MHSRFFEVGSIAAFCILLGLGFYIIYPFLDILLVAVIFSYLVRPAKEKLPIKNETVSTFVAGIIVLVPLIFFVILLFVSLVDALVTQHALKGVFLDIQSLEDTLLGFASSISQFLGIGGTEMAEDSLQLLTDKIEVLTQNITKTLVDWAFSLPYWAIRLFLAAFLSFYFVRDGKGIKEALLRITPESNRSKFEKLLNACDAVVYGIVVGYLSKAIITGFLSVIVFSILGIGNPFIMGVLLAVFDFIPLIGPWTIFVGLFLWYTLQGDVVYGIQVAVICYLSISLVPELYIRPKISGTISHVHPAVMLVGILGGLISMGAVGVLAGPLILGIIVVTIKSYFLNMEIEREDIIDRIITNIKQRIFRTKKEVELKDNNKKGNEHPGGKQQ
jgi:predicted PurR-regulated permease PerM